MNEADTRAELIDPALKAAGWGDVEHSFIRREVIFPGHILASGGTGGKRSDSVTSDYVLVYQGRKLAAVEAKKVSLSYTGVCAKPKTMPGACSVVLPTPPTAMISIKWICSQAMKSW